MFFFGLASNFITLAVLGVFSVIFLYQGVKDATLLSKDNSANELIILSQDYQQNISSNDFQLTFADTPPTQDDLTIYPKFVLIDCSEFVEDLPEKLSNKSYNRGPPALA
ncbi:MAG: hypothetical protein WCX31_17870 [Salinivirgaceae bacterium]